MVQEYGVTMLFQMHEESFPEVQQRFHNCAGIIKRGTQDKGAISSSGGTTSTVIVID